MTLVGPCFPSFASYEPLLCISFSIVSPQVQQQLFPNTTAGIPILTLRDTVESSPRLTASPKNSISGRSTRLKIAAVWGSPKKGRKVVTGFWAAVVVDEAIENGFQWLRSPLGSLSPSSSGSTSSVATGGSKEKLSGLCQRNEDTSCTHTLRYINSECGLI